MKKLPLILISLPVVIVFVMLLTMMRWKFSKTSGPRTVDGVVATNGAVSITATPVATISGQPALLGETILLGYASTNLPAQNDLTLMSRLMDNSLLLLKSAASQPLSANEDWAALFRGANAAHERFLPDSSIALNATGQLIDRWGTPLFFHALGNRRHELRSAGPDGKLWTDDDIHRNADGSFRRGAALNPPSLLEEKTEMLKH